MCKQAFLGMHNWLNLYGKYILICKIQSLAQMKQCVPGILSAYLSYHGALTLEITFLLHELPSLHTTHSNSRKIFSRIHNIIQTFLLRFAFSVMHESGRAAKKGSTYHVNDVRWTWLGGGDSAWLQIHSQSTWEWVLTDQVEYSRSCEVLPI